MQKNTIILGMARSGTSMTAAIFARVGYFVAEDLNGQLQKADHFNPSGYWEAIPLLEANKEVLNAAGFDEDNTWFHKPITTDQVSKIGLLDLLGGHKDLLDVYNRNEPWVWKDPRLCYTLKYWWKFLNHENTAVILLRRSPEEIYKSFQRVNSDWNVTTDLNKDAIYKRINEHIQSAESILKELNIPYVDIDYADYRLRPDYVSQVLSEKFGINLSPSDIGYKDYANHSRFLGKLNSVFIKLVRIMKILSSKSIKRIFS